MTVTPFATVPAAVAQIQSAFATLSSASVSGSNSLPEASDPFSVLLDAAQTTASAASTSTASESAVATTDPVSAASVYEPLVETSSEPSAGAGTDMGNAVVAEAAKQIGLPYVWGGESPTQGFDCSGLVQYTFAQLGVSLPRTAAQQEQVGTPVASLAEAQPGDLLFFEPGQNGAPAGEAGHVAIYIGNNEMIAAPETGQDVQVQTVPGTPLAIRRITTSNPSVSGSSSVANASAASSGGTVPMGKVAVPATYAGLVEQAAAQSGTPASFLAAVLQQESGYNPYAVSSTGAQGIAQIEPETAAANGITPFDPTSAISGAARLLASYHTAFGSWSLAAAAYNAGVGAVEQTGGIPQNGQTPSYVQNVMSMANLPEGS